MSHNYPPSKPHSISTISEEYESGNDAQYVINAPRPKGGSSVRYIVTDPNDVQFVEQSKAYPTVTANSRSSGFVNSAFVPDENADPGEGFQTSAAAARAARRSRRRMRRQQQIEGAVSPDTSSDDVAPYLNAQQAVEVPQPKGIIKGSTKRGKMIQNGDVLDNGNKVFHLKRRGDAGYGFAYRDGMVSVIVPGSEADKAGLREGDKIVEVNGVNMEGQDKDAILEKISKNKKNLILVVLDGSFTPSESSDLNESGSELSDSVDRSSGSSVRFKIEGRMHTLKPGESVASLDTIPMRNVVNFNPNPQPKRSRRHHNPNSRGVYPPPANGPHHSGSLHRHQSPGRNSGRGSQRHRSRSRSPASANMANSRARSPGHTSSHRSSRPNGSLGRSSQNSIPRQESPEIPIEMPTVNMQSGYNQPLYNNNKPAQLDVTPITNQPTTNINLPKPDNLSNDVIDSSEYGKPSQEEDPARKGLCCGTYSMWAAFTMIFCLPCIPLGAMAYVYANRSTKAYALKDYTQGEKLATVAGYFIAAGILFGAMAWLGVICAVIFSSI